ncbi:calcium-binding protein [Shimia marina]|uniref:Hemolysin, chromosomal n=1 Tax=Shimia marina TaxID=321267 RepID=A0A0P1EJ95_9RHOB|nr:calcium-binding protein [Shimia marina]CUH50610.1 Hemolysin, chromosomal [Shimia marina]SFE38978.1 Hemolysin-type calcium-binding repeat-containing protein [Shimia marina]
MPENEPQGPVRRVVGTTGDDSISTDAGVDAINGHAGDDTISTGAGNDLAAGDMVGSEWSFVGGRWVYNPANIVSNGDATDRSYNDVISTGAGDDVLLGNGGEDLLSSGAGDDLINAGDGHDTADGGLGDDLINLEAGNDRAQGGLGADTINAGSGNDLVFGDLANSNLLTGIGDGAATLTQFAENSSWTVDEDAAHNNLSQAVTTETGETYTIRLEAAANLAGGADCGCLEVLWNGEAIGTITATSGVFETHSFEVTGDGSMGALTLRELPLPNTGPTINMDGPIYSYDTTITLGGEEISVAGFAPGQSKLFQMIDGQLNVFDPVAESYEIAGPATGLRINAIGFNTEDDLIYGIAKANGMDALGNPVSVRDLVMVDAEGQAYRVGETPIGDYVGDFDDQGNLWTFQSSLNRVTRIDVNALDDNGNPEVVNYDLPNGLFQGRTYDVAYNASEGIFYAVESPGRNGEAGAVHRIDLSGVPDGGAPEISSVPITATLNDDGMTSGMPRGAYGAVFMDGEGNLFFGLNRGDHDLDGTTDATGAIYRVEVDWQAGTAYSELMAEAQSTGSNDGAVDPRAPDPFAPVDRGSNILIRDPEIISDQGGNDDLRGGSGDDTMFGGAGDDTLHGGADDDQLHGDAGADRIMGGSGNDSAFGGAGNDSITTEEGHDRADGGAGQDYINTGEGNDLLSGGDAADRLVGGTGSDTLQGGAGNDHLWGGNWWRDGDSDTFVAEAGGGRDMIHDFEVDQDVIDLSSYGINYTDLQAHIQDQGWATVIDLSALTGGASNDRLILKSVDPDDLDESNFLL